MNFEELSGIWNNTDMDLDKSVKINKELVKKVGLSKVKSRLYEIKWTGIFEVVVSMIFLDFLLGFLFANFSDVKFFIPALILVVITVFSLGLELYKLALYYTIDSSLAVIEAQKKLARLRKLEILDIYSLSVIIPLFSSPFLIVVAKALLDISLYDFGTSWILYYTGSSVVIAAIIIFFLRRYLDKNLSESITFLNELKESEEEVQRPTL